jgi:hypothetical protein
MTTLKQGVVGMALQGTISSLKDLLGKITQDLHKAESGNKAAAQRVRTMTVRFEKIAKNYRKESISTEKNTKGSKKAPKKSASKAKAKPAAAKKPAPKAKPAAAKKPAPKAKAAALSKPRALTLKKPTAKLPVKSWR